MYNHRELIQNIFDRQLKWAFRTLCFFGLIGVVVSLSRSAIVGWQNVMFLHIALYLVVVATTLLNKRLSFFSRAWILIGLLFIIGIGGLITWGLLGFGIPALIVSCVICTIVFGIRAGVLSAFSCLLSFIFIALAYQFNYFSLSFDPIDYLDSFSSWASGIIAIVMSTGLVVFGLGSVNTRLQALIEELDQSNAQLMDMNKKLETEIQERERLSQEKTTLQVKLERAQKMEVVANVAGGVAHDLNNVLAGAVGYPDILSMQLPEDSPLRAPVEKIKKSGLKAAAMVNDLLALVRRGIITRKITNLNLLLSDYLISPEFEKLIAYHPGVRVETFQDEALWNMKGSPIHILKALMNLVSNAAEAITDQGTLTLSTRNVRVPVPMTAFGDIIPPGEYVVLSVEDTGSGMSPKDMENLFEPFFSKKVLGKSGTGLGMTVVWGVVKDHDGFFEIQSVVGKGTSIKAYFPASHEHLTEATSELPLDDFMGRGESILVVDDVEDQREVAAAMLTTLGYAVTTLANGEAALDFLGNSAVDLVVIDMILGSGMDGLETYQEIIKRHPTQKTVLASGYWETDRVKKIRQLGLGNCLSKPFTLEKLGKTVKLGMSDLSPESLSDGSPG